LGLQVQRSGSVQLHQAPTIRAMQTGDSLNNFCLKSLKKSLILKRQGFDLEPLDSFKMAFVKKYQRSNVDLTFNLGNKAGHIIPEYSKSNNESCMVQIFWDIEKISVDNEILFS
jgi:hypothetical protein